MSYHQTIYNLLRGYGLSEAGALGMLGNWECESGCERAENSHRVTETGFFCRRIAAVSRRIDADGARRHLRNRHNVREFRRREPLVLHDGLGLDEREHSVAAAETEEADLEESDE